MTIADANRVRLSYILETTYGAQVTVGNLQTLRQTGESLKQDTEINAHRFQLLLRDSGPPKRLPFVSSFDYIPAQFAQQSV